MKTELEKFLNMFEAYVICTDEKEEMRLRDKLEDDYGLVMGPNLNIRIAQWQSEYYNKLKAGSPVQDPACLKLDFKRIGINEMVAWFNSITPAGKVTSDDYFQSLLLTTLLNILNGDIDPEKLKAGMREEYAKLPD